MPKDDELALKKLIEAADKDPELRARLCKEPELMAKELGIKLGTAEVQQLERIGALMQLVDEFKQARVVVDDSPIFYPIDVWWKRTIFDHIIRYRPIYYPLFYPIFYHIFYPIFYPVHGPVGYPILRGPQLGRQLGVFRKRFR